MQKHDHACMCTYNTHVQEVHKCTHTCTCSIETKQKEWVNYT